MFGLNFFAKEFFEIMIEKSQPTSRSKIKI